MQTWCTSFPIWNQSIVPCTVLTIASWPAYRFLRRRVRWSGIHISLRISTVCCDPHSQRLWMVNKAEVDVFLELSFCFDDPADVGNLISGSSALSKSSLNIWKFTVRALLKPSLENFEHYFASMWYECNCAVVWTFFDIAVLGLEWKLTFFSHVAIAEFSKFAGILSAMQETQVLSLGWEDPLEEEIATHSNILAWKIPWTEEPGGLQSIGLQRVRHDWVTNTHIKYTIHVMCLNYPETTPPSPSRSMKKLFSMKPVPGTKKVEDCCFLGLEREFLCGLEVEGTAEPPSFHA